MSFSNIAHLDIYLQEKVKKILRNQTLSLFAYKKDLYSQSFIKIKQKKETNDC